MSLTHTVAAALRLSALLLTSALDFSIVKYLGAAYLIYLGVRTLLVRYESSQTPVPAPTSFSRVFAQGFLVNLLNPQTALFFYAFLPQFVDLERSAVRGQILFLGVLFVLLASCTDSLYALLGSTVGKFLSRHVRFRQGQRYITGGVYIVLGVTAAVIGSDLAKPYLTISKEEADYHVDELITFWQLVSKQGLELCERVQRGVRSTGYHPEPLSYTHEYNLEAFLRWHMRQSLL